MSKIGISIKVRVFRELEVDGCLFRCYESGKVERRLIGDSKFGKKGSWIRCDNNKPTTQGRLNVRINGKTYLLHRIVYLAFNPTFDISDPTAQIDHIDGDPLNNRIENLREATNAQNACNRKVHFNNKVGLKNITDRGDRWVVQITKDRELLYRSFSKCLYDLDDVIQFRDDQLLVHHGEFARL